MSQSTTAEHTACVAIGKITDLTLKMDILTIAEANQTLALSRQTTTVTPNERKKFACNVKRVRWPFWRKHIRCYRLMDIALAFYCSGRMPNRKRLCYLLDDTQHKGALILDWQALLKGAD